MAGGLIFFAALDNKFKTTLPVGFNILAGYVFRSAVHDNVSFRTVGRCVMLLLLSVVLSDGSGATLLPSLAYKPELNAG